MITELSNDDLKEASQIHREVFSRQLCSLEWLSCSLYAYPRFLCYVAKDKNKVIGYIIWSQKSGFRTEVVIELEQIAVLPEFQGKGIGGSLIKQSLEKVKLEIEKRDAKLKHLIVSTRADNQAQKLYQKILGAEVEATITNLYSADEVLMVARCV